MFGGESAAFEAQPLVCFDLESAMTRRWRMFPTSPRARSVSTVDLSCDAEQTTIHGESVV